MADRDVLAPAPQASAPAPVGHDRPPAHGIARTMPDRLLLLRDGETVGARRTRDYLRTTLSDITVCRHQDFARAVTHDLKPIDEKKMVEAHATSITLPDGRPPQTPQDGDGRPYRGRRKSDKIQTAGRGQMIYEAAKTTGSKATNLREKEQEKERTHPKSSSIRGEYRFRGDETVVVQIEDIRRPVPTGSGHKRHRCACRCGGATLQSGAHHSTGRLTPA